MGWFHGPITRLGFGFSDLVKGIGSGRLGFSEGEDQSFPSSDRLRYPTKNDDPPLKLKLQERGKDSYLRHVVRWHESARFWLESHGLAGALRELSVIHRGGRREIVDTDGDGGDVIAIVVNLWYEREREIESVS
ncbi:hypothetical protein EV1_033732 [Malus domestica]